jgi:very-short-patch-repair endonuclease
MASVAEIVDELGGIAQKRQLIGRGVREVDLTRAVREGSVVRVRHGWYSTLATEDPRLRAVRVGGRLTGISAIQAMGGWVLGSHPLHVAVPANASRLRSQWKSSLRHSPRSGVVVHWCAGESLERGSAAVVALADALLAVVRDEALETAVAALDWALHSRLIDMTDLAQLMRLLPRRLRRIAEWVDPACEGLPESLSRTRLRIAGHRVETQVVLDTGERIDLVVDGVVAVEVDGDEYHRDFFERDRRKDLTITIAGYHALRPSARAVFGDWDRVLLSVRIALAARMTGGVGNSGDLARSGHIRARSGESPP